MLRRDILRISEPGRISHRKGLKGWAKKLRREQRVFTGSTPSSLSLNRDNIPGLPLLLQHPSHSISDTARPRKKVLFRPCWRDGKSRPESSIVVINGDLLNILFKRFFDQKGNSSNLKNLIMLFWLIQSQSKGWSRSPAWRHIDPKGRFKIIFLQVILDHFNCLICYFQHTCLLFVSLVNIVTFFDLSRPKNRSHF